MKVLRFFAPACFIALIASTGGIATAAETTVSFVSLLNEMIDRDVLARLPQPAYTCRQASSYERLSVSPDDPAGWMANNDWSHFIRSEQINGRTHWVMLDAQGPGCIVRIWSGGPKPKGKMRFYLDGWFTIQYPDPQGKARGQFGDAHCVFDCKYNLYNPRLDAITHYNLVNKICDKKFVAQRHYPNRVQAYLFRDASGGCLQVLWWDDARGEHFVPLPAKQDVELVHLDGTTAREARFYVQRLSGGNLIAEATVPVPVTRAN